MYFDNIPDIQYDVKPISYPFTESEFVVAKNFFRRFRVNEEAFSYAVFFNKYSIQEGDRPDTIAQKAYGDQFLDWVIILTNNLINPLFDWPLSNYELEKTLNYKYDDPYATIHHYETYEIKNDAGYIVLPAGMRVDETFYNGTFKYYNNGLVAEVTGSSVCRARTVADWFSEENEKKREIYILKAEYLQSFIKDFKTRNKYKKSGDYINNTLKKTSA